jgi:tricorn protease
MKCRWRGELHGAGRRRQAPVLPRREGSERKSGLKTLAIGNAGSKPELLVANVREFDLARDKKHVYYRTAAENGPGEMLVIEAGAKLPSDLSKAKVKVDDWTFVQSAPGMEADVQRCLAHAPRLPVRREDARRGLEAARDKYAPLVERVTDRAELNDVLGMMMAEVGALHSQIRPGDCAARSRKARRPAWAPCWRAPATATVEHIYAAKRNCHRRARPCRARGRREGGRRDHGRQRQGRLGARDIADLLLNQADKQVCCRSSGAMPRRAP